MLDEVGPLREPGIDDGGTAIAIWGTRGRCSTPRAPPAVTADGTEVVRDETIRPDSSAPGSAPVKGGTLYPILTRLEEDGLVDSSWRAGDAGPGRKYFAITASGRRALREQIDDWQTFTGRVAALTTGRITT